MKREAFIGQYLDELGDNIRNLDDAVIALKRDPENEEELNRALRILHTIKGSSRMLQFGNMEKLAHGLESVLKGVREKRYSIGQSIVQLVFATSGKAQEGMRRIRESGSDEMDISALLDCYAKAYANEPFTLKESAEDRIESKPPQEKKSARPEKKEAAPTDYQSVRVSTERIDDIIKRLDNLIINQFQFKKHYEQIRNIEEGLKESADKSGIVPIKEFQKLRKSFAEQLGIVERDTFALQEMIIGLRMFPLNMILGAIPKMVEEMAMAMGKKIRLEIRGGDIRIDKAVLEAINDPIVHLVRNAVDHAIETPDERKAAGKSEEGFIEIACRGESGSIALAISDDGRGINYAIIRDRALELFPSRKHEISEMQDEELVSFLFVSGFSTSKRITEISGRGVGLNIVKFNIERVKGKVSLESVPGKGTVFTLRLPLTLATIEGYFVKSENQTFFVPGHFIREVLLIHREDMLRVMNRDSIKLRDRIIPLLSLQVLIGKSDTSSHPRTFAMVVESLGSVIAISIDSVMEYTTLIFKSLPKNLAGLSCIQGIVFDEDYNIVSILHVPALVERSKRLTDIDLKSRRSEARKSDFSILVIDDSKNSREIQKSILESAGYTVMMAEDGIEGLELLRNRQFHLVLTDLPMPRMDGYTLIENMKRDRSLKEIPVIVVSGYDDADSANRALNLGAEKFIVKSSFDRIHLIDAVDKLLARRGEGNG